MDPTTPNPDWPRCPEDGLVLAALTGCGPAVDDQPLAADPGGEWLLGFGAYDDGQWSEYVTVTTASLPDTAVPPPGTIDLTGPVLVAVLVVTWIVDAIRGDA